MHKPAIAPLVFSRLFPISKSSDPSSFQAHITRNLVPEVRLETVCFYGPIDCLEAQYPGLDYANSAHRARLGRYTWHRKLFRALDELRLSNHEIQTLCRWEGTRWAREKYEKEEGQIIRDTTWDDIELAVHIEPTATRGELREGHDDPQMSQHELDLEDESEDEEMGLSDTDAGNAAEGESEDELQQSIGVELNHRLIIATEARARGEDAVLDPAWEQWLKEAAERGVVSGILGFSGPPLIHAAEDSQSSGSQDVQFQPESRLPPSASALRTRFSLSSTSSFLPHMQSGSSLGTTPSATAAGAAS